LQARYFFEVSPFLVIRGGYLPAIQAEYCSGVTQVFTWQCCWF